MDYQFRKDLYGSPQAQFSMGHEAIGHWINSELGCEPENIKTMLETLQQHQRLAFNEYSMPGREFSLQLHNDEVSVIPCAMQDFSSLEDMPEGTEPYDQELNSGCGLDDFIAALKDWLVFVSKR